MKKLKSKKLETTLNSLDNNDLQASQKWIAGQQWCHFTCPVSALMAMIEAM